MVENLNGQIEIYNKLIAGAPSESLEVIKTLLEKAENERKEWTQEIKNNFELEEELNEEKIVTQMLKIHSIDKESIVQEENKISILQERRNKLNKTLKGAYPFIPKMLTPTFIENYNKFFSEKIKEGDQITKEMLCIREALMQNSTIEVTTHGSVA